MVIQPQDPQAPVPFNKCETQGTLTESDRAWLLWETMAQIYANRWVSKNGVTPSQLWTAAISTFSDDRLAWTTKRCMDRCSAGNHWPPDLAEFTALAGEYSANPLGLQVADVMAEYWRWARKSWKYESNEDFPWRHPLFYQICPELKSEGARRNLPQKELEALAKRLLNKWVKHVEMGYSIPPIRKKLDAPARPTGPTPAQQMAAGIKIVK